VEIGRKRAPRAGSLIVNQRAGNAHPNIILILADHHRWDCAGFNGNTGVRTPNLDALAAHGVVFPNAAAPSTAPVSAYATLLTGRLPWHHGIKEGDALPANILPHLLQDAGYHTGCVGALPFPMPGCGFHAVRTGEQAAGSKPQHITNLLGNAAVHFLQRAREPFFLWLSFSKPSPPLDPPEPWSRMYDPATLATPANGDADSDQPDCRPALARYYALLSQIDWHVGRLLATLTARGFTNNFILYSALRGAATGRPQDWFNPEGPPHECLLRVPMLAAGHAGQRQGKRDNALVGHQDIAPTLLTVAGLQVPPEMEGKSIVPLLRRTAAFRDVALAQTSRCRIARDRRYKLIEGTPEWRGLYDLQQDPLERNNLYGNPEMADIQAALEQRLDF